ncbi:MFS transporter [bacterium]|nr:MFS transporter [bacterium]
MSFSEIRGARLQLYWYPFFIVVLADGAFLSALQQHAGEHNKALYSQIYAIQAILTIVLGIPLGSIVDRLSRKSISIICICCLAAIAGLLMILSMSMSQIFWFAAIACTYGIMRNTFFVGMDSLLREIIPINRGTAVIEWRVFLFNVSRIIAIPAGGLIGTLGVYPTFAVTGALFAGGGICLIFLKTSLSANSKEKHGWRQMIEGITILQSNPQIALTTWIGAVITVTCFISLVLIVPFARNDPMHAGWILGAGGIGGVIGSLGNKHFKRWEEGIWRYCVAIAPVAVFCFSFFALTPLAPIFYGIFYLVLSPYWVVSGDAIWRIVDPAFQGRVRSAQVALYGGIIPVLWGLITSAMHAFQPEVIIRAMALLGMAVIFWTLWRYRALGQEVTKLVTSNGRKED